MTRFLLNNTGNASNRNISSLLMACFLQEMDIVRRVTRTYGWFPQQQILLYSRFKQKKTVSLHSHPPSAFGRLKSTSLIHSCARISRVQQHVQHMPAGGPLDSLHKAIGLKLPMHEIAELLAQISTRNIPVPTLMVSALKRLLLENAGQIFYSIDSADACVIELFLAAESFRPLVDFIYTRHGQGQLDQFDPHQIQYVIQQLFQRRMHKDALTMVSRIYYTSPSSHFPELKLPKWLIMRASVYQYSKGIALDNSSFNTVLWGLSHAGFLQHAMRLLKLAKSPTSEHYQSVIHGYLHTSIPDIPRAYSLLQEMLALNHKPSRRIYVDLLKAYMRLGSIEKCHTVLAKMALVNIKPSNAICNEMLKYQIYPYGINTAEQLQVFMHSHHLTPDIYFLNTLIHHYTKMKNIAMAWSTFDRIVSDFKTPNSFTLSAILNCAVKLDFETFPQVVQMYTQHNIPMNHIAISTVMHAYIHRKDTRQSLEWFGKMIGFDFNTNVIYTILPCQHAHRSAISAIIKHIAQFDPKKLHHLINVLRERGFAISHSDYVIFDKASASL